MRGKEPTFLAHNRSSHWQPLAEKDQLRAYVDKPTLTYMSNWACERPHKNSSQHPCIEDAPLPLKLFAFANGLVDLGPFLRGGRLRSVAFFRFPAVCRAP